MRRLIRGLLLLGLGLLAPSPQIGAETPSPAPNRAWGYLEELRDSLAATPQGADFVQTYLPAGFSSGEQENGRLALALPDCLRWDYETPYAKTFLLCDDTVYSWNEGETSGRRQLIEAHNASGLDLLRLGVDGLRQRYAAALEAADEGRVEVVLTPLEPDGEIASARFAIDPRSVRLLALGYSDLEGNLTRFEISGYSRLGSRDVFVPPEDIHWLED
jgi:outer membrane lipoprotein-sorting protein